MAYGLMTSTSFLQTVFAYRKIIGVLLESIQHLAVKYYDFFDIHRGHHVWASN
jgi:hypothetical protein